MGPKYDHFKFEIGDFVQHVVSRGRESRKMQIIERWYQECPGGVQLHYSCRAYQCNSARFIEIEIEPYVLGEDENLLSEWMSERAAVALKRAAEKSKQSTDADFT